MITRKELEAKLLRKYPDMLRELIEPSGMFPFAPRVNLKIDPEDHKKAVAAVRELEKHSRERLAYGYTIEYVSIRKRQFGVQTLPRRIVFTTVEDCLRFIGKKDEADCFVRAYETLAARFPMLAGWGQSNTGRILRSLPVWDQVLETIEELRVQGIVDLEQYAANVDGEGLQGRLVWRGLPVSADTKFIERNLPLLRTLMAALQAAEEAAAEAAPATSSVTAPDFGLDSCVNAAMGSFSPAAGGDEDNACLSPVSKRSSRDRLVWVRLCGCGCAFFGSDLGAFPFSRFQAMSFPVNHVLVVENRHSFLQPVGLKRPLLVIWGQGNACQELALVPWLKTKRLFYWGDLDLDGFRILGRFRRHFPTIESVCMNVETYRLYERYAVAGNAPGLGTWYERLHPAEQEAARLLSDRPDANRLEQERIEAEYAAEQLRSLVAGTD